MPSEKRKFGDIGEKEAEEYLKKMGYEIIRKNYRVKNLGEIDLISKKDKKLVFFEVKTRSAGYEESYPIEFSLTQKKIRNLKRICQIYLSENRCLPDTKWQVDSIFVIKNSGGESKIRHLENIVWEEYY